MMRIDERRQPADDLLLQRMRSGDTRAFVALTVRYWAAVSRVAYLVADAATAASLVASAFLRLRENPASFPDDEPLRFALYSHVIEGAISGTSPRDHRFADLHAAVSSLAAVDRLAFILRRIEGLPEPEAAKMLRMQPEEVRRRAGRLEIQLTKRILARE